MLISVVLPVTEHHVPGKLISLQQQVLNRSLGLSDLPLQSGSGVCQFLCHDSVVTTLFFKTYQHDGYVTAFESKKTILNLSTI